MYPTLVRTVVGQPGQVGPRGPTGFNGIAGPMGASGVKGAKGRTGQTGMRGVDGCGGQLGARGKHGDDVELITFSAIDFKHHNVSQKSYLEPGTSVHNRQHIASSEQGIVACGNIVRGDAASKYIVGSATIGLIKCAPMFVDGQTRRVRFVLHGLTGEDSIVVGNYVVEENQLTQKTCVTTMCPLSADN